VARFSITGFSTGGTGGVSPITIVNTSSLFSTGLANYWEWLNRVDSLFFGRSVNDGQQVLVTLTFFWF
jgi:hypothetical protein